MWIINPQQAPNFERSQWEILLDSTQCLVSILLKLKMIYRTVFLIAHFELKIKWGTREYVIKLYKWKNNANHLE